METKAEGPGVQDVQTVTAEGVPTVPTIEGVELRTPPIHIDHRGALFEIYNGDPELWPEPAVYAYADTIFPGQIKGWNQHATKIDRYTLVYGELLVVLYDGRPDSPTQGVSQQITMSTRGTRQIRIPAGVWHLLLNLRQEEGHLVNLPTERYNHAAPDRKLLPWDTDQIPVDVKALLPKF